MIEGLCEANGLMLQRFAHHGRHRSLMILVEAYVKTGNSEKGRALFNWVPAIKESPRDAAFWRTELKKLKDR